MSRFVIALSVVFFAFASSAQSSSDVKVTSSKIVVNGNVYFDNGQDKIKSVSLPLLNAVSKALIDNPRFTKVTIQGHTDSVGNAAANRALSLKRAKAVKRHLVKQGVASGRLVAKGFGGGRPISSNKTEAGRAKNRRVVFIVDGIRGKRPPLAKVSARVNKVEAREPKREQWKDAPVGTGLYKQWRVQSRQKSSADITFRDASQIHLREDTLVIVYGANTEKVRRFTSVAELEHGSLRTRLDELSGGGQVLVKTPSAEAAFKDGQGLVSVDKNGESIVANHGGNDVVVTGRSKSKKPKRVKVKDNYGSKVVKNKPPQKPRLLPPAPKWSPTPKPTFAALNNKATVFGGWTPVKNAQEYRVELVRKEDRVVVAAATVPAKIQKFEIQNIEPGSFSMRVSTVDNERFESKPGKASAFEVVGLALEGGPKGAYLPGTQLFAPKGGRCQINGGALANVVVLPAAKSVEVSCIDKNNNKIPSVKLALATFTFKALSLATVVGEKSQWRFALPEGFGDKGWSLRLPGKVEASDAQLKNGELVFDIAPQRGAPENFTTALMRNGVELETFNVVAGVDDSVGPLIENIQYKNRRMTLKVTDDKSQVKDVAVFAEDGDSYVRHDAKLNGAEHIANLDGFSDQRLRYYVLASDAAGNQSFVGNANDPLVYDARPSWLWGTIPMAIGVASLGAGGWFVYDFTQRDAELNAAQQEPDTPAQRERIEEINVGRQNAGIGAAATLVIGAIFVVTGSYLMLNGSGFE